jgi:tRNA (guanine37-N1)-methyltransferase
MKLRIDIVTLFPEAIRPYLEASVLGKAQEKGVVFIKVHNLRSFTQDRYRTVDDYPFGGGPGMVLKPEPLVRAVRFIEAYTRSTPLVVVTSPQGELFTQKKAWELSKGRHILILCGRYQGIDERVIELTGAQEISIGDYVLSGGELPALVIVEAVVRLIPGVLGDEESLRYDSFSEYLFGPPQYTRPRVFCGLKVPEVLLSGDHALIERWRREKALEKAQRVRPELFGVAQGKE